MAKMSAVVILFSVLFLDRWPGGEPHPFPLIKDLNNTLSSSPKNLDKDLANIFDEILLQVLSKDPHYRSFVEGRTTITSSHLNENDLQPSSLKNPEPASSSNQRDEHLAQLFDEILLQVFSKDPHYRSFVEGRTTITSSHSSERDSDVWNSPKPEYFPGTMYRISDNDLIAGEKRDKQASLFHRAVTEQKTTVNKEILQGTVSQDTHNRSVPCGPLLHFLQKNIIIAALAVAAILVVTVLLMLMLAMYVRRKRPLHPPANMTYNIFIMNGKSWWQKSQETNLRKIAEKQKHLKYNSYV